MFMIPSDSSREHKEEYIFVLSAKEHQRLLAQAQKIMIFLSKSKHDSKDLSNICYTLQTGREMMECRVAFLIGSMDELVEKLQQYLEGTREIAGMHEGQGEIDTQKQLQQRFSNETDYEAVIHSYLLEHKYEELLKIWTDGISIPWEKLYEGMDTLPRIISVPSYSFDHKKYWAPEILGNSKEDKKDISQSHRNERPIERKPVLDKKQTEVNGMMEEEPYRTFYIQESWSPIPNGDNMRDCKQERIVCFISDKKAQERMIHSKLCQDVIIVEQGIQYMRFNQNHYMVGYENSEDYFRCFQSIQKEFGNIDGVFYFWAIENKGNEHQFYYDIVTMIIQGFAKTQLKPMQMLLASSYENDLEHCYAESQIGFDLSATMILPDLNIRTICKKEDELDSWIDSLTFEYRNDVTGCVWYDDGTRKSLSYQGIDIKKNQPPRLRKNGVYLITGGLGGIGIVFTKLLLEKYQAKLILTGRRSLEEQEDQLVQFMDDQKNILYIQADVCDEVQMKSVISQGKNYFGYIDGVIHAAGIEGKGSVLTNSIADFEYVVNPKTKGTISLLKVVENEPVDFICLFSSTSAILGDFGSCDYAVGNRFLMAVGRYLCPKVKVINWSLWRNGGMAVSDVDACNMYLRSTGQAYIEAEDGTRIFEEILCNDQQQVAVVIGKESNIVRYFKMNQEGIVLDNQTIYHSSMVSEYPPKKKAKMVQEDKGKNVSAQRQMKKNVNKMSNWSLGDCILDDLKEITKDILGLTKDEQKDSENLADFGYDSISLATFANSIRGKFKIPFTPDKFFSFPTLERLCNYMASNFGEQVENFYLTIEAEDEVAGEQSLKYMKFEENESHDKHEEFGEYDTFYQYESSNRRKAFDGNKSKDLLRPSACLESDNRSMTVVSQQNYCEERQDRVSIVGISGRFPDATDTEQLWSILEQGSEVIREIPGQRKEWYSNHEGKQYDYQMGLMPGIDEFDPLFFEISPADAVNMAPEQRLLLEQIWNALEDAGYGSEMLQKDKIGVFVGAEDSDYKLIPPDDGNITANNMSMLSARIAYFLDLKGPNMTVNTACSSGLMAVHQAYCSIMNGECDTAIAAGVSVLATSSAYDKMESAGMLSADRRCYVFDSRANGMVPAEAVAVVVLKRESKAIQDRNRIYGTVIGSGTNYDGRTNGITAPSGESQKELLKSVYERFDIDPKNMDYIIAHGTSTRLGDPIEMNALTEVFQSYTDRKEFCAVGSVKSNIGHTLASSGVVSLISLVIAMEKEIIPKQINCESKSDYINWDQSPFYLNEATRDWKDTKEHCRMGAVSAFGMGGTNVHIVVESVDQTKQENDSYPCKLLVLSAKTEEALVQKCKDMIEVLEAGQEDISLVDISYTLMAGREHFAYRLALITNDRKEAASMLRHAMENTIQANVYRNHVKRNFKAQTGISDIIKDLSEKCADEKDVSEYKKMLGAFADFYCQGYELYGERLFANRSVQRVKLPTYPFAKEKYWKGSKENTDNDCIYTYKEEELSCIYANESWSEEEMDEREVNLQGTVICFLSKEKEQVAVDFMKEYTGPNIIFISQGDSYWKESQGHYRINRRQAGDYELLLEGILKTNAAIDGIAYLWTCEEAITDVCGEDLIYLLKAIHKTKASVAKIFVAGTYQDGVERSYLESLLGFQRSLGMVLLTVKMQVVIGDKGEHSGNAFLKLALQEYLRKSNDTIWYDSGIRKMLSIDVVELEEDGKSRIAENGCYMITGGLGGIGFLVAKWLLQQYHAKVVLVGRQLNALKESRLHELKELSDDIRYYQADVCDRTLMEQAVKAVKEEFGAIHGVFHAAGIGGNGNVLTNKIADYRKGLAPKIQGTLVLDEIFQNDHLDFICYFSSTSAIFGDFGSCEYAVGNRFMMSHAQELSRRVEGQRSYEKVLVINWPLWKEGGMTMGDGKCTQMYLKASGQRFLQTEEAMRYLDHSFKSNYSQLMVLVGDKKRLVPMVQHINQPEAVKGKSQDQGRQKKSTVVKKTLKPDEIKQALIKDLQRFAGQLLKISVDKMDYEAVITEFGFDSMSMQQFSGTLNEYYGIEMTPDVFYAYPTLLDLSEYFVSQYPLQIENKYTKKEKTMEEAFEETPEEIISLAQSQATMVEADDVTLIEKSFYQNPTQVSLQSTESIAIIGISGLFPDAMDVDELWNIMVEGKNVIKEAPSDRDCWHKDGKVRKLGCIPGIAQFDPLFFEIPPSEAEDMDPRQRLLLQEAWKALENAGYGKKILESDTIGVFVGAEDSSYQGLVSKEANLIANHSAVMSARLSYLLNLRGPNLCINTACSSGLSALHEACLSIKNGECDVAIVAGVNLLVEPSGYDKMMEAGMLSETQTCYPFDKRANGMVPAEAVAVVVLKRLSKAVEDKNPIMATIVGSGINYDGKTNGITAPSGKAQARLIKSVYEKNHINPRDIGYIIAHGTGTRLGDPIEMNALVDLFHEYTMDRQFCAVGSVKANVGHTLAASGIVSLIVLVMAMQKEMIPQQINCDVESDYIRWNESPFYFNRKNHEWKEEEQHPRLGAVSSFGMSGTNVHVVVESYLKKEVRRENINKALFVLSAKKEQTLNQKRLELAHMMAETGNDLVMQDVSYTLIEGRRHYPYRCAFVASSWKEAADLLCNFNNEKVLTNRVKRNYIPSESETKSVRKLEAEYRQKNGSKEEEQILYELADKYVSGLAIDGDHLFPKAEAYRCMLPTYPFSKEKYWTSYGAKVEGKHSVGVLHPLVGQNVSSFTKQEYDTTFSGTELVFKDHVINGKRTLPGVAYLEMARFAAENAAREIHGADKVIRISNVGWFIPMTFNEEPIDVHIQLVNEEDQTLKYEILSQSQKDNIVHSQGCIEFVDDDYVEVEDINQILTNSTEMVSNDRCYQLYSSLGMEYGPNFSCIKEMNLCGDKVVTKLHISQGAEQESKEYVLIPGMMDGGLQSTIGFVFAKGTTDQVDTNIPFALDEVTVYDRCQEEMWAIASCASSDSRLSKYDVKLCDNTGKVCIQIKGYVSRSTTQNDHGKTILLERKRKFAKWTATDATDMQVTTIYVGMDNAPKDGIVIDVSKTIDSNDYGYIYEKVATSVFLNTKDVLKSHSDRDRMIQVIVPNNLSGRIYGSVSGILRTAHIENPSVLVKVIEVKADTDTNDLMKIIDMEKQEHYYDYVIYADNQRYIETLEKMELSEDSEKNVIPWKDHGVYLITGGAGGLGGIFAKEIARRTENSIIVLTGRSQEDERIRACIRTLEQMGAKAAYWKMDVTNRHEVEAVVNRMAENYGTIHGVIHSAGIISDQFIIKKSIEEFQKVYKTKVMGTTHLDWATRNLNLDFMIYFSSVTGELGNLGQAEYAAANRFMDNFAYYRNVLVSNHQRSGRTMAVNWPLWKNGGMKINPESADKMNQEVGFLPLPNQAGIQALYAGWSKGVDEVFCLYGEEGRIDRSAEDLCKTITTTNGTKECSMGDTMVSESIKDEAMEFLKNIISMNLKIPLDLIEDDSILDEFGLDSIAIIDMIGKMEETFGVLPKTLFYEYSTLEDLADYFVRKHEEKLVQMMESHSGTQSRASDSLKQKKRVEENIDSVSVKDQPKENYEPYENASMSVRDNRRVQIKEDDVSKVEDIAIIGMSGRYPMARDLEEFWNNLVEGKDCVTEIPKDRWNPDLYYDPDKNVRGKYYTKDGGFMEGVYEFDPLFFAMAPKDAKYIDPQERLFLQCVYETIEDAGYTRKGFRKRTSSALGSNVGVYLGSMSADYPIFGAQEQLLGNNVVTTGSLSSIANRVSYVFDFHGPSLAVDTMCSSSLYALHLACQSIQSGESDAAVVGGINLCLHPNKYLMLCDHKFGSARGRCESFSDKGEGYVPGEGVVAVLLKPLSKAKEDKDHIYGIIKGTSINHGGAANGYLVPNPEAQAEVIGNALKKAGINPRTISYVEAHGTGTSLGDPIEIAGLQKAYEKYTYDTQFCKIGSVKSNIGHLEGAAGIAGVTKVLLQMKYKQIVPSIHADTLNPYIDFVNSPFIVSRSNSVWNRPMIEENGRYVEYPRRAAISSFGAGGSNAHVIIEEYMEDVKDRYRDNQVDYAIVLSAKSNDQLKEMASRLLSKIETSMLSELDLPSLAYTLQIGRELFDYRLGIHVTSIVQLVSRLKAYLQGNKDGLWVNHVDRENGRAQKTSDYEMKLQSYFRQRNMNQLLNLWSEAVRFDWDSLYMDEKPQKISLPTYPFLKDVYIGIDKVVPILLGKEGHARNEQPIIMKRIINKYESCTSEPFVNNLYIEDGQTANKVQSFEKEKVLIREKSCVNMNNSLEAAPSMQETNDLMVFQETWQEKADQAVISGEKIVVCFAKDLELIQTMNNEIDICDAEVTSIWVICGERYQKNSYYDYTITYDQNTDYEICLNEIRNDFGKVDTILYLNPISDRLFVIDMRGIIYILQGMKKACYADTRLILAGAFKDTLERAYVEAWIGIERSIAFENNNIKLVMMDQNTYSYGDIINLMLKETYSSQEDSVFYEDGIRKELAIHTADVEQSTGNVIKQGGTYLITGGMGGLGLIVASWLGHQYDAKVVLTGRSSADQVYEKVKMLEDSGIKAIYVPGDVCDTNQMSFVIQKAKAAYGHIDGIFHAAGIESEISLFGKEIDEYQHILSPKMKGTIALDQALKGETIDFICYFSSISAVLGDFGFSDYAVANRFLMGYTEYRNNTAVLPGKAVVICWPLWKDGGMGFANEQASTLYLKTSGQSYLLKEEGMRILERLLNQEQHQFIVMTGRKDKIYRMLHVTEATKNLVSKTYQIVDHQRFGKQGKGWKSFMKGWMLEQSIMWDMKEMLNECVGVSLNQMDENLNLAEFGFDSVSLSDYARIISQKFEISFSPNLFYNYATLNELARFITATYANEMKAYYAEGSTEASYDMAESRINSKKAVQTSNFVEAKTVDTYINAVKQETVSKATYETNKSYEEPIAIVGISGKFPDANDPEQLWDILFNGKEVIHNVAKCRNEWDEKATKGYQLGSLRNIDEFDNEFFEVSPREAENMDPRQRLLLEESWKALEDAGFGNEALKNERVGVFVGAEDGDYHSIEGNQGGLISNHNAIMAARISYFLNLNGPNMSINTACSSGLVAVHQACQSLRTRECDIALAAGVNLFTTPISYSNMEQSGMLSPDRKCYAFDQRANGMVPAEAVAVVILKRLSIAEKDHNTIYGVIRGSGINYDGRTNGITAPSGRAQAMLLKDVYEKNGIRPGQIDYVVTHGTSTKLGDPVEITALLDAYQGSNVKKESIALTSNKPNIGHALAASGVVSLISLLMAMKHETIPASINCSKQSDYVNWEESPFYINTKNRVWKDTNSKQRVGAVSAFGMSGTNALVVVESYPSVQKKADKYYPYNLFVFSAKTEEALNQKCKDFLQYLENDGKEIPLEDISYTLIEGRQHFAYRIAIVVADKDAAIATLKQSLKNDKIPNVHHGLVKRNYAPQEKIQTMVTELCHSSMDSMNTPDMIRDNLNAIAEFYCIGYHAASDEMFHDADVRIVQMPHYPFESKKFWVHKTIKNAVKEVEYQKEPKPEETKRFSMMKAVEPVDASFESIVEELTSILAKALYIGKDFISYDKSFMEMGLDSIIGVEWIRDINKTYKVNISSTKIYQYPSIFEFAKYVQGLLTDSEGDAADAVSAEGDKSEGEKLQKMGGLVYLTEDFEIVSDSKGSANIKLMSLEENEFEEETAADVSLMQKIELDDAAADGRPAISFEAFANELANSLAEILYIEKGNINYDRSFMEIGLDSIIGVEWIRHINKIYKTNISSTKIYQYPNITEFTKYLQELLVETVAKGSEEEKAEEVNQLLKQVYEGDIDLESALGMI